MINSNGGDIKKEKEKIFIKLPFKIVQFIRMKERIRKNFQQRNGVLMIFNIYTNKWKKIFWIFS